MMTKRLQYRYDAVGNKVGMTDADGGLFTYTYDVMRRLTGVINPVGERTTYTYDLNGRRTSAQLSNGTRTSYLYDQGSRVQQIHTLKSNNSTVAKFDYAYDDNGRRTSVLEADGSRVTWTYDGTSQVTSEWRTGASPFRHTFVYDTRGNRTLKVEDGARTTLVYDAANQLSSSEDAGGTSTYTYDGNGNQHVTVAPGGSRTTQIWDYENRLVKTLQPGGSVFTMAYDADGLRIRKETPSEAKLFVWDDQNYLAETDDTGVTEVAYTTEPSTYGSTISHRTGGATTTYHFDALAAARVLTNSSETVLESYNYTAFGTILGTPSLLTPFLWGGLVGYYWDADLATQYIRARHYQPSIARWISLDPIGFAGGDANLFRYVGDSPTSGGTGMRLRLATAAYGKLRLVVAPIVFRHLSLDGAELHRADFVLTSNDPAGLDIQVGRMTGISPGNTAGIINGQPIYQRVEGDNSWPNIEPGKCYTLTRNGAGKVPCPDQGLLSGIQNPGDVANLPYAYIDLPPGVLGTVHCNFVDKEICRCSPCGRNGYRISCNLDKTCIILLDKDELDRHIRCPEFTYGHEQRHVWNQSQFTNMAQRAINAEAELMGCMEGLSKSSCETKALVLAVKYLRNLRTDEFIEGKHLRDDPKAGGDYRPIGEMPPADSKLPPWVPVPFPSN